MKSKILINFPYLEIGGAERALLGLLSAFDPERVDVDLLLNQHTGDFMPLIPSYVHLIPEIVQYSCIRRPLLAILKEGHLSIVWRRLRARLQYMKYLKTLSSDQQLMDGSFDQYIADSVEGALPSLHNLGEYDLAISFINPHNIVLNKIKAKRKLCWMHTDYSTIHVDHDKELKVWGAFDKIISISEECTKAFLKAFPEVKDKIVLVENILSPTFIRQQAELSPDCVTYIDADYFKKEEGVVKILSIGRFAPAKHFEAVPHICAELEKMGVNFKWYILGYGDDAKIQQALDKYQMRHRMLLLGKKTNPYPYIKACDIYAQPSIFEGKSVTVREAQILGKPVVITNYPTAKSQVQDGVDGVIVPLDDEQQTAIGIAQFIQNTTLRHTISEYLSCHDYGNESEVEKIYSLL